MNMKFAKTVRLLISIICVCLMILVASFWRTRDYIFQLYYDIAYENVEVNSIEKIQEVLNRLEIIDYKELDIEYKNYTKSDEPNYRAMLSQKTYFKIRREDMYKRIVGALRIKDFLAKDKYYKSCLYDEKRHQYWLADKKLLFKLLELKIELKKLSYNENGFRLSGGHRNPLYNEKVKGAKLSRHIKGEAVDMVVQDVNNDGEYTKEDKEIILILLEKKILEIKVE